MDKFHVLLEYGPYINYYSAALPGKICRNLHTKSIYIRVSRYQARKFDEGGSSLVWRARCSWTSQNFAVFFDQQNEKKHKTSSAYQWNLTDLHGWAGSRFLKIFMDQFRVVSTEKLSLSSSTRSLVNAYHSKISPNFISRSCPQYMSSIKLRLQKKDLLSNGSP